MTLSSTTVKTTYAGDSSTTDFATVFTFWNSSELKVILVSSSGSETTWTEGTEYSVTGGAGSNGTVAASTNPTDYTPDTGELLTIKSNVLDVQETDLPAGGAFPSSSVEDELDRIVRRIQQKEEIFNRIPTLSEGSTFSSSSGIVLPDPEDNSLLAWSSSDNTKLKNMTANSSQYLSSPVALDEGGTAATTAAGARTSLGAQEDVITTAADIIIGSTGGSAARLAASSSRSILISDGSSVYWSQPDLNYLGTDTRPYDIAFKAGYTSSGGETDVVAQEYGHVILARDVTFEGFEAYAETAPGGAALQMDVELNGTTIFSTSAPPEIDAASNADDGNHNLATTTGSAGDRLMFEVIQIGSTTAGSGLMATLKARTR